jgi:hypothetical protein
MDQLNDYADERLLIGCIHCAGKTGTRDHMPSRVLLDEPYPENLPVVPACPECNAGFSLDEEYFACLVECARTGSAETVERPKVRRILDDRPALSARLKQARTVSENGEVSHSFEGERIERVVLKLARGHAAYELSEQQCGDPSHFMAVPIHTLSADTRSHFEEVPTSSAWPEVGTRAMQRIAVLAAWNTTVDYGWIEVQPKRYRYFAVADGAQIMVRIVVGEYLACEVIWGEED